MYAGQFIAALRELEEHRDLGPIATYFDPRALTTGPVVAKTVGALPSPL